MSHTIPEIWELRILEDRTLHESLFASSESDLYVLAAKECLRRLKHCLYYGSFKDKIIPKDELAQLHAIYSKGNYKEFFNEYVLFYNRNIDEYYSTSYEIEKVVISKPTPSKYSAEFIMKFFKEGTV